MKNVLRKETQDEIKRLQKELAFDKKMSKEEDKLVKEKEKEKKEEVEVVLKYKEDVEKYEHLKNKKLKSLQIYSNY